MDKVQTIIKGVGGYLPQRVVTNDDLAKMVDTSDNWITERTGIKERRIAADGELTSFMGAVAARAALDDAGMVPDDIDHALADIVTFDEAVVTDGKRRLLEHRGGFPDLIEAFDLLDADIEKPDRRLFHTE